MQGFWASNDRERLGFGSSPEGKRLCDTVDLLLRTSPFLWTLAPQDLTAWKALNSSLVSLDPRDPLLPLSAWTLCSAREITNVPQGPDLPHLLCSLLLESVILAILVTLQCLQTAVYLASYLALMAVICGSRSGITHSISRMHLFPIIDSSP